MLYIITTKYCIFSVLQYVYIELLRNTEQLNKDMIYAIVTFAAFLAVVVAIIIWLNTKSGKKWLASL